ncbi:MAG TPA: hypothetical protein PLP27_10835 [Crocinitomicaceae bacterium]|nr:hypothetical protein [Crocinitomicaceae bacterium]
MKNWVLKYSSILLLSILFSCSNTRKDAFLSNDTNLISLATDSDISTFDFYGNDVFSKLLKDLVCEPLFYYNSVSKEVKSNLIRSYKWIHESEIEFTLAENIKFQNRNDKLYKDRFVTVDDIIHSLQLCAKQSPYPQTRAFLATFIKFTPKAKNKLIISLDKSVLPQKFMLELATNEIPIIPKEVKKITSPKEMVGTRMYAIDAITHDELRFKLIKGNKQADFSQATYILVKLNMTKDEQLKAFETAQIDGLLLSDVAVLKSQLNNYSAVMGELFVRQEDELCVVTLNVERPFTAQFSTIEYVKKLLNPQLFNQKFSNNQLNVFYSIHDLENPTSSLDSLDVDFKSCPEKYKQFVYENFQSKNIKLTQNLPADLTIFNFKTPTNNTQMLNYYLFQKYVSENFIGDETISLEANIKLFQPVRYLLFTKKIKFLNDNFNNRNDFSVVFKGK